MSGTKNTTRLSAVKKDGGFRYATRNLALEKNNKKNNLKESSSSKGCDCPHKADSVGKGKNAQNSKQLVKKGISKCCPATKDLKKKATSTNHREKVVIVSKRSSSVSVVKSCNLRKSVSVRKVSYSTSVVLSSDEDSDSEDESEEEERKEISKKRKTILKHTTSKVKSSVRDNKKNDEKNAQKAKALKLLCNKLSYDKHNERELRPRFPYNMLQEWPTARTHRMASLNALAKVHVLYENEGRTVGENLNDADESSLIDFLNENSDDDDEDDDDDDDDMEVKKESKPLASSSTKKNDKNDKCDKNKKAMENEKAKKSKSNNKAIAAKGKAPKRGKKRKLPEVEIIDTRICKRMASLNAQAILAASYLAEPKPKRVYKKVKKDAEENSGSNCDLTIIKTEIIDDDELTEQSEPIKIVEEPCSEITDSSSNKNEFPSKKTTSEIRSKNWSVESKVSVLESSTTKEIPSNRKCSMENSIVSSTASTKVGVTQYTEVTKVQINTNKETEIKEESKSERKIEHIISNDDVAITQMYHYQSKSTNESYCLQMQTTYKPAPKSMSPSVPADRLHSYIQDPSILPGAPGSYYGRDVILPPQAYPSLGPIPAVGDLEHRLPRQYGSAFTVPHYRQPPRMPFAPTEYGYYQPAGPLIQPNADQRTIHKPVPYHPPPNPQPPQRPQQPSPHHRDRFHSSFEPHHSSKLSLSPQSQPMKQITPSHSAENSPQLIPSPSSSSQLPRPQEDLKNNRSLSSRGGSFNQPPSKHVRSPVMPTLYSSQQNFRAYQTQKRVVPNNSFNSYSSEKKDQKQCNYESPAPFNNSHSASKSKSRDGSAPRQIEVHSSDRFKHLPNPPNLKEKGWGFKNPEASSSISSPKHIHSPAVSNLYGQDTRPGMPNPPAPAPSDPSLHLYGAGSSHFIPYQDSKKGLHSVNPVETSARIPARPPSVIEIIEDTNTKTYIQLEVPQNSHREKIVVVDVEDDEVEKLPKENEKVSRVAKPLERNFDRNEKSGSLKRSKLDTEAYPHDPQTVKKDRLGIECVSKDINQKAHPSSFKHAEVCNSETPDVMVLEVKKRKESAVVRRARLHGKQRTFRDCYNRPLEQMLLKTKNSEKTREGGSIEVVEKTAKAIVVDVSETDAELAGPEKSKDVKIDDVTILSEQSLPPSMQPLVLVPRYVLPEFEKTPVHGWSWEGSPNDRLVYISNDEPPCMRRCYPAVRHMEGDLIRVRDCVFLRSGPRKTDVPFVAKVTALWGNPINGDMTMSLLWYYRPEHTETIKKVQHSEDEIFASKHRDTNSVACIEDKCYVLTYFEYCRYKKRCKLQEQGAAPPVSIVPHGGEYFRENRLPSSNISPDLVLFCRKVYDYRQRRLLKNPL